MYDRIRAHIGPSEAIRLFSSLILALLLWGWVTNLQDPERTETLYNLNITAGTTAEGMQLVGALPTASVRVSGPQSVVDNLTPANVELSVDLSSYKDPGTYTVDVEVKTPKAIRTQQVTPSTVQVLINQTVSVQMPLTIDKPNLQGDSRSIVAVTPTVSTVTVTGAQSIVDNVSKVALPIEIGNNTSDFQGEFTPVAQDAKGQAIPEVTIQPAQVTATVRIQATGKSVAVLSSVTGDPAAGYEVVDKTVNPATVLIDGPADELTNVFAVSAAPVDVAGKTQTVQARQPIINLPKGIHVIRPTDGTVVVVVQIRQHTEPQPIPGLTIKAVGLDPRESVTINPNTVQLQLVAPEQTLAKLQPGDVQVSVNVSGLGPGTYDVHPSVSVPANVQWADMQPNTVKVVIAPRGPGTPPATPSGASIPGTPQAAPPTGTPASH